MNLHSEWMTNNTLFGDDYANQLQIQQAKERFELQKLSNEGKDATIDGVSERVVTQVHTNSFIPNKDHIKLHTSLESSVKTGSIVKINNIDYIVTDDIKNNGAYKSTEMLQTNNTLKFYKNGISLAIPCIFSDGNVNLDEGRFLSLPSGHYLVTIPSGYITKSDTNIRYILNDAPYKTFGINNATNGLIKIELIDDSEGFNDDDNRLLGIANYWSNQPNADPSITGVQISVSPIDTTINKGETKVFTAIVTNDGVVDNVKRTIWIITNKDGTYTPYVTMTYDNRTCTLVASNDISALGKVINLKVVLEDNLTNDYTFEITVKSII